MCALALCLAALTQEARAGGGQHPERGAGQPIDERLDDPWRWRQIEIPPAEHPMLAIRPWGESGVAGAQHGDLHVFDGYQWSRHHVWQALLEQQLTAAFAVEDGLLLFTGMRIAFWREAAAPAHIIDERTDPRPRTPPCQDAEGRVLTGLDNQVYQVTSARMEPFLDGPPGTTRIFGLGTDADGTLYASCDTGLWRRTVAATWERLPGQGTAGRDGRLPRVVTGDEHVYFLPSAFDAEHRGMGWDGQQLTSLPDVQRRVADPIEDAAVTNDGTLIVASRFASLRVYDDRGWTHVAPSAVQGEYVRSLCVTEDGRLVILSGSGRMFACDIESQRWRTHDTEEGGVSASINALALAPDGRLWVGTHDGIALWNGSSFDQVWHEAGDTGVSLASVTTLCVTPDGQLYAGSGSGFGGYVRFDGERWHHHTEPEGVSDWCVHRIRATADGSLWFALLSHGPTIDAAGGLARRSPGGSWTRYTTAEGLPDNRCYDLAMSGDGEFVAATGGGLAEWRDDRWARIRTPGSPQRRVFALHVSRDGDLWAGCGLNQSGVYVRSDDRWRRLRAAAGRPLGAADFVDHPVSGVFFSSHMGLSWYEQGNVYEVTGPGELPACSFWPLATDQQGTLWIGSHGRGLIRFAPDDKSAPQIIASPELDWHDGRAGVTVSWLAADWWNETAADSLRSEWKLDNDVWEPASPERQITLSHPKPGRHTLQLRVTDQAGNSDSIEKHFLVPLPGPELIGFRLALGLAGTLIVAMGLFLLVRNRQLRLAQRRLHVLNVRLLSSQETEARKISRDLHDDLGQVLTATALELQLAQRPGDETRRANALDRALEGARDALQRVRRLSSVLRPRVLDELGLHEAVSTYLADHEQRTGMAIVSSIALEGVPLSPAVSGHLYRILQEALTNITRHSEAGTVRVELRADEEQVLLQIEDDGVGFDPRRLPLERGVGLAGMRERAHLLGGSFTITSRHGLGTRIKVTLPPGHPHADGDTPSGDTK